MVLMMFGDRIIIIMMMMFGDRIIIIMMMMFGDKNYDDDDDVW